MKRTFVAFLFLSLLAGMPAGHASSGNSVFCFDKSDAYEQYKRRPQSELSKLLYLKEVLQKSGVTVIYNGRDYDPEAMTAVISTYVKMNYKKENAENWITQHAYRSASKGQIIYLKDPQGHRQVLKDVLLQELKTLPA